MHRPVPNPHGVVATQFWDVVVSRNSQAGWQAPPIGPIDVFCANQTRKNKIRARQTNPCPAPRIFFATFAVAVAVAVWRRRERAGRTPWPPREISNFGGGSTGLGQIFLGIITAAPASAPGRGGGRAPCGKAKPSPQATKAHERQTRAARSSRASRFLFPSQTGASPSTADESVLSTPAPHRSISDWVGQFCAFR
jgi:hypothetical protein